MGGFFWFVETFLGFVFLWICFYYSKSLWRYILYFCYRGILLIFLLHLSSHYEIRVHIYSEFFFFFYVFLTSSGSLRCYNLCDISIRVVYILTFVFFILSHYEVTFQILCWDISIVFSSAHYHYHILDFCSDITFLMTCFCDLLTILMY